MNKLTKEEALEALDRIHFGSFKDTDPSELTALINHHFDMVERVEKMRRVIEAAKTLLTNNLEEGADALEQALADWRRNEI